MAEAERWIQTLDLPKSVKGSVILFDNYQDQVTADPKDKIVILRAAKRLLEKRGARVFLSSDES